jgi:steroid delta-isomerase-like uncharacterized protein
MLDRDHARGLLDRLVAAYNRKDVTALATLYDEDVTLWSSLGEESSGKGAVLHHVRSLFRRLPDETMTAETVVTDGETVVAEFTSRGTSADGQPYELRFTEVFQLRDGLITEIKTYIDPEEVTSASG